MRGLWPRFGWGWPSSPLCGIITQAQYSYLGATVIGSAVVPTMIANAFFMPRHLLPRQEPEPRAVALSEQVADLGD